LTIAARERRIGTEMSTSTPHPPRRSGGLPSGIATILWVLVIAFIVMYVFLVLIGAWKPKDVIVPTVAFFIALLLLTVLAAQGSRQSKRERDPRLVRDRERRGF
jgi:membrane protein implicated in regulation of membrane protease activity